MKLSNKETNVFTGDIKKLIDFVAHYKKHILLSLNQNTMNLMLG